jgi:hypothetical protein
MINYSTIRQDVARWKKMGLLQDPPPPIRTTDAAKIDDEIYDRLKPYFQRWRDGKNGLGTPINQTALAVQAGVTFGTFYRGLTRWKDENKY